MGAAHGEGPRAGQQGTWARMRQCHSLSADAGTEDWKQEDSLRIPGGEGHCGLGFHRDSWPRSACQDPRVVSTREGQEALPNNACSCR